MIKVVVIACFFSTRLEPVVGVEQGVGISRLVCNINSKQRLVGDSGVGIAAGAIFLGMADVPAVENFVNLLLDLSLSPNSAVGIGLLLIDLVDGVVDSIVVVVLQIHADKSGVLAGVLDGNDLVHLIAGQNTLEVVAIGLTSIKLFAIRIVDINLFPQVNVNFANCESILDLILCGQPCHGTRDSCGDQQDCTQYQCQYLFRCFHF